MNKESANTMLKFLEEPDGSVIGFFITNHIDNVLLTIQSRCQHIEVNFDNDICEELEIAKDSYDNYLDVIKKYLEKIEVENKDSILYNKECLGDYSKEEKKSILQIILKIYQEKLNDKLLKRNSSTEFLFLNNLSLNNLKKKVNLLINILKEINYNVNEDLLLDKFVIKMEDINNESL